MNDKTSARKEERIRAAEKTLGSPVILESTDELSKTRLRLLVIAIFAIAIGYFDLKIVGEAAFGGIKIVGLSTEVVRLILVSVLCYLTIHFGLGIWEGFLEWRLRLTGLNETLVRMQISTSKEVEVPRSARQLTLYSWWLRQATSIGDLGIVLKEARTSIDRLNAVVQLLPTTQKDVEQLIKPTLDQVQHHLQRLATEAERAVAIVDSDHIRAALRRFDRRFMYFLAIQNLRWLLFECLAPVLVGIVAIILLAWPWCGILLSALRRSIA